MIGHTNDSFWELVLGFAVREITLAAKAQFVEAPEEEFAEQEIAEDEFAVPVADEDQIAGRHSTVNLTSS